MIAEPVFAVQGVPVFRHEFALAHVRGRAHPLKPWMRRRCYHARVQKKWDKRFGALKFSPTAFFARHGGQPVIFMHPLLIDELRSDSLKWSPEFMAKMQP